YQRGALDDLVERRYAAVFACLSRLREGPLDPVDELRLREQRVVARMVSEGCAQPGGVLPALARIALQRLEQDGIERRGHFRAERGRRGDRQLPRLIEHLEVVLRVEQSPPRQQLVQHDASGP